MKNLNSFFYFPSTIYSIELPEYLKSVKKVSDENLKKIPTFIDEIYPVRMTGNFFNDERITDFVDFIGNSAWNILDAQGYNIQFYNLMFSEMWTQEHHKHSLMEQHIHGQESQIVGFYFLEVPDNSSKVVFHDPRPGKIQNNLPEKDIKLISEASSAIHFEPSPGLLILSNSWLPHSFSRHSNNKPLKFVHFNISAIPLLNNFDTSVAEVI